MISLSGKWRVKTENGAENDIVLPGTLNANGLGYPAAKDTEWVSGLFNPFWYEREEYKSGLNGEFHVPFLSQPRSVYSGEASYSHDFFVNSDGEYYLFIEVSKWRLTAFIDDVCIGSDESLCAPFLFGPFCMTKGVHEIKITVDNSYIHPYRPDSHGISDCLCANWNGMAGRIDILNPKELQSLKDERATYMIAHPSAVEVSGNNVIVNGKAVYLRGTHFGGGFYDTLYPATDNAYWDRIMKTVKGYGFNFIRFHSFCPPEAAFVAADNADIFLQVECGMWNVFNPGDDKGFEILLRETRKILENFGHHSSFIMLSATNEPSGSWYKPLREWVSKAKEINRELGFEGRRLFTAQSGWFYDTEPSKTEGTDYLYFHRSAFGPIHGGMIRNRWGWGGKDYSPSVEGARLPVISHEMGQWCAYPDLDVVEKFTGAVRGGNYEIFKDLAVKNDVYRYNKDFVYCSGRNQVRFLKEEFEANFRTPEITGFEYLDLHDYTGQGTAVVGVLDPFFDSKCYVTPWEFRTFNSDIVILPRIPKYVFKAGEKLSVPVEICNYSGKEMINAVLEWEVTGIPDDGGKDDIARPAPGKKDVLAVGKIDISRLPEGRNTVVGTIDLTFENITKSQKLSLTAKLLNGYGEKVSSNGYAFTVFVKDEKNIPQVRETKEAPNKNDIVSTYGNVKLVRTLPEALKRLENGETVLFMPYLSDLDFDCPLLSFRSIFWNAQMGPTWSRQLGLVIDKDSALFKYFPTEKSGGWEWEEISERARTFNLPAKYRTIVRAIDDWNRNFPLSFIFEGRVLNGKLLFCAADLEGSFEERPAAYTLKNALIRYAASGDFAPWQVIDVKDLKKHIRPMYKGADIIKSVTVNGEIPENIEHLTGINPNWPFKYMPKAFPVTFKFELERAVKVKCLYALPIQNDRDFPGVIREYGIRANGREVKGEWKNAFWTQYSVPVDEVTDTLELTVYSTYNMGTASRWVEKPDGYYRVTKEEPLQITCASLGIDFEEATGSERGDFRRGDEQFWRGEAPKRFKEIDL
jgi:hypothetical protein